jgi:hypothetical protein
MVTGLGGNWDLLVAFLGGARLPLSNIFMAFLRTLVGHGMRAYGETAIWIGSTIHLGREALSKTSEPLPKSKLV